MTIDFAVVDSPTEDAGLPRDTVPETEGVEYPCQRCGREAGPYGGRGRKPKFCAECKPKRTSSNAPRVTGTNASLAAQASEVLSQINSMVALGCAAMKLFDTAGAIAGYDDTFKAQAYAALTTDPELCRFILKGGVKSAKITLLMAYGGMAVAVAPHAITEVKYMQAERRAKKADKEVSN